MTDEDDGAGQGGITNVIKERQEGSSVSEDIHLVGCSTGEAADFALVPICQNAAVRKLAVRMASSS